MDEFCRSFHQENYFVWLLFTLPSILILIQPPGEPREHHLGEVRVTQMSKDI